MLARAATSIVLMMFVTACGGGTQARPRPPPGMREVAAPAVAIPTADAGIVTADVTDAGPDEPSPLTLHVLDSGQGDCALLQCRTARTS